MGALGGSYFIVLVQEAVFRIARLVSCLVERRVLLVGDIVVDVQGRPLIVC